MIKRIERNHRLDKDRMCFHAGITDYSDNFNSFFRAKEMNVTEIGSMKRPVMMMAVRTGNRMERKGKDNSIINILIYLDFFGVLDYYHNVLMDR